MEPPVIDSFTGEHAFLSNFYVSAIPMDGVIYPTVEHAFQAAKTNDHAERQWIMRSPRPGLAKARGRRVELRPDWEDVKLDVMLGLLRLKFSGRHHPDLVHLLIATSPRELVEGNYWGDRYWGMTKADGEPEWRGENHLGRLLMQVRAELIVSGA